MTPSGAFESLVAESHRTLDVVMGDVTPEMLAWSPPGEVLPIGVIFAHAIGLEDLYVQQLIRQLPLIWEAQQWAGRLGHMLPPNQWNVQRITPPNFDSLRDYQSAVRAATLAYVRDLSPDDLDRQLQFPGRTWSMSVAQLLGTVIAHTLGHAGEIAILKGLQGGKGLPY
jgi:DinB superfamily